MIVFSVSARDNWPMRRLLFLAASFSLLSALPLGAQSRVPGVPIPGSFFSSSTFGLNPRFQVVFGHPTFDHGIFVPQPFVVPVPFYGGSPYPMVVQTAPQAAAVSVEREMQSQIDRLREEISRMREESLRAEVEKLKEDKLRTEIERLREEQEFRRDSRERRESGTTPQGEEGGPPARSRWRAQPAPRDRSAEEALAVVLVFRDGHRREIRNFAVVGQTLWDFNEDRATKILLSALDLDATAKLNEERGVEFHLPTRQRPQ